MKIKKKILTTLFILLFYTLDTYATEYLRVDDRLYIDEADMTATDDAFYLHQGDNEWFSTHSVHKDKCGTFTYRSSIICEIETGKSDEYAVKWKCPYCYQYWPKGQSCQNKDCPSRYK